MNVCALGNLSGITGDRAKGEAFVVTDDLGQQLLERELVELDGEPPLSPTQASASEE